MVKDMADQFMEADVRPVTNLLEKQGPGLMPGLIEKTGELGLLGTAIPEEYGGLGRDFITTSIVCEELSNMGNCFSVSFLAHTGIGMLPILYFGTEAQRQKYIPKLVSANGRVPTATEPNSGSDALGARSTARLSDDGKYYILNGQKCWITNGGFAEVYTVFAQLKTTTRHPANLALPHSFSNVGLKVLHKARKKTKWALKALQPCNYISRIASTGRKPAGRARKRSFNCI